MSYRFRSKQKEDEELSSGKEIVYTLDLAGNFTFLNEVGERFSGYSCDEACRMNITQVVAPELADYVRHQITRTVREWFGAVYEIEIITKDQRRVALETSTHIVLRDGQPIEDGWHGLQCLLDAETDLVTNRAIRCGIKLL